MCVRSSVGVSVCESQQCFDQVQLLSMFAGENGGFLVVLHEFVHGVEPALADTVHSLRHLHFKVLILTDSFQGHREITGLEIRKRGTAINISKYTFLKANVEI